MKAITEVSAIYHDAVNNNLHWGIEANFPKGSWELQTDEIFGEFPPAKIFQFDFTMIVFFNRDKPDHWLHGQQESRGTMLVVMEIGGFQVRRPILQSKGMMTPVVIPAFTYHFSNPATTARVELQYQGEVGCNFEIHTTAELA